MTKTMDKEEEEEDLIQTKTIFRRHSKGPVMFNGCSPAGDVIIIDNISLNKSYDLTGWSIERQTDSQSPLRYTFIEKFILPPLTTVELWSSPAAPIPISEDIDNEQDSSENSEEQQHRQTSISMKVKLLTWNPATQWSITRLFNSHGQEKAIFSHRILTPIEHEKEEKE